MRQMRNTAHYRHALISRLLNILYPSLCPACGNPSDQWTYSPVCSACWSQLKRYSGPSCMICALPVASEHARICGQCMQKAPPFSRVITYGLYEGVLAQAIHQFKFHRIRRLSKPLGNLLLHLDIPHADGIIPVPLSKKGLIARGFNQSLLISHIIAKHTGITLCMDFLFKTKDTPPQIGLSARERLSNLKNAFEVHGNLKDLRVLLVDDVITTGATVRECSKMLMKAGAQEVIVLALARAPLL